MTSNVLCHAIRNHPPSLWNNSRLLVIDGFLTSAPDSTYITLTRSRNIGATASSAIESNATLTDLATNVIRGISAADKEKDYEYLQGPDHLFTLYEVLEEVIRWSLIFAVDYREHGGTSVEPGFWP
jgi:hypothetical protein